MCSAAVKRATLRLLIGETCRTQSPSFQHESKMFDDKEAEVEISIVRIEKTSERRSSREMCA